MKDDWVAYLESIDLTEVLRGKVQEVVCFYQQVHAEQIQDIFVTEYVDKAGNRQYGSVWLFSEELIMEAKRFVNAHDFDSTPLKQRVHYWQIKKNEYDFQSATKESRMVLDIVLSPDTSCELKASGKNCDYLKAVFIKHVVPNLSKCPVAAQIDACGCG